jgi:hypothetical protein
VSNRNEKPTLEEQHIMNKVGGHRNFGYGKQMEWAGKQALRDRYGNGHYGTAASHTERWQQFVTWCRDERGIRDANSVDQGIVNEYGEELAEKVAADQLSVAYAHNLQSTVNVVLEAMRGDRRVRIAPAKLIGQRTRVRTEPPAGLDRKAVRQCANHLRMNGHERIASVVELARELGLRLREASMLNVRAALAQAMKHGAVNITAGTKGGRGHRVDRWVPVSKSSLGCLLRASKAQEGNRNLIPADLNWRQWNIRVHHVWAGVRDDYGLARIHDLRAAYACDRYRQLTGSAAPVITGRQCADRSADRVARQTIAQELGHGRIEVVSAYIGGAR